KGMFTKEIEEAMADRRIDLTVHSLKDVPTMLDTKFTLAAVMERENAQNVFVSKKYKSINELPHNARVKTSNLRRVAQLKTQRQDLKIVPLRDNVNTRIRKMKKNE